MRSKPVFNHNQTVFYDKFQETLTVGYTLGLKTEILVESLKHGSQQAPRSPSPPFRSLLLPHSCQTWGVQYLEKLKQREHVCESPVWGKEVKVKVAQSCLILCDPTVHGILQARKLEWVAFPFSRESSQPRDRTQVSCIAGRFFTIARPCPTL